MNFSAHEYWTDGWREGSLMPNDEGLRRCGCGAFVLKKDLLEVEGAVTDDLPRMDWVSVKGLFECIADPASEDVEIAARFSLWRHLNHIYRAQYRQHRDAEEASTEAAWRRANPDRRNLLDKVLGRRPVPYVRPVDSPFTYPKFEPSSDQLHNMGRLTEMLKTRGSNSEFGYQLELAELYREQRQFDEAAQMIQCLRLGSGDTTIDVIDDLIKRRESAPMRYRP